VALESREPGLAVLQPRAHQLHAALVQRVLHHFFVLFNRHGAGGVHHHPARLARKVHAVDGRQQQLLLEMRHPLNVFQGALDLDRRVPRDHAEAAAGGVEQDAVEAAHDLGEVFAVVLAHHGVGDPQAVQVGHGAFQAVPLQVVGDDGALVLHELRHKRGLAPRGCRHVQNPLPRQGRQGKHGAHRRRGLDHVVAS